MQNEHDPCVECGKNRWRTLKKGKEWGCTLCFRIYPNGPNDEKRYWRDLHVEKRVEKFTGSFGDVVKPTSDSMPLIQEEGNRRKGLSLAQVIGLTIGVIIASIIVIYIYL